MQDKKLVIHVITGLGMGGAEANLYKLACFSKNYNHQVISLSGMGYYGPLLEAQGINVIALNLKPNLKSIFSLLKLFKILRKNVNAIIQTWMYHADFIVSVASLIIGNRKIFWGLRNTALALNQLSWTTRIVIYLNAKLSYFVPKKIISCSMSSSEGHAQIGYDFNKFINIPNGYDIKFWKPSSEIKVKLRAEFSFRDEQCCLIMVARWDPLKDHLNLLKALSVLKLKGRNDWKCFLIGPGISRENAILNNYLLKYDLHNNVNLFGPQSNLQKLLNVGDIFVLSSKGEGFPNVIAEAMLLGIPCVATDVGESRSIIGDTGKLVPPQNSEKLALEIEGLMNEMGNKVSWNERCLSARERIVANFDINNMFSQFEKTWINFN
jgi:glycosyltransferase involved in cell wall biosynthesis